MGETHEPALDCLLDFLLGLVCMGPLDSIRSNPADTSPTQGLTAFLDEAVSQQLRAPSSSKGGAGRLGLNSSPAPAAPGSWPNYSASESQFPRLFKGEVNSTDPIRSLWGLTQ